MRKRVFLPLIAALVLTVCHAYSISALADESNQGTQTIRVAYPIQAGLTEIDENGNYTGYTYEYLEAIAQYTGWQYEFVQVEGTQDEQLLTLMDMLQKGEVDLMGAMLYSDELSEQYVYSTQSYGTVETVLQTTRQQMGEVAIDAYNEQILKVAVINDKGRSVDELRAYCSMNLITPEYILCAGTEEQVQAIHEGRADVLLNNNMNPIPGVVNVAGFAPKPFYFVTAAGTNREMMQKLNQALTRISDSNPAMQDVLYEKYFVQQDENTYFTSEEESYLKEKKVIRIGAVQNQPPYLHIEEAGQKTKGILQDLADIMAEKTGVPVEVIPAPNMDSVYDMAAKGQIDLIAGMPYSYEYAEKSGVVVTQPYLNSQYVRLLHSSAGKKKEDGSAALLKQGPYQKYAYGNVVYYDTVEECVKAVLAGEQESTYIDSYTAQYFINSPEFWELRQAVLPYKQLQISFGMLKPVDELLLGIVNKTVLSVTEEEKQQMVVDNALQEHKLSFVYYIRRYPLEVLGGCLLVFLVLLFLIQQRLRANKRVLLEMEKQAQVYEILDDHFFEYNYKTKELKIANPLVEGHDSKMADYSYEGELDDTTPGKEFLKTIKSKVDGEFEIYDYCIDGEYHWLRGVIKTIYGASQKAMYTVGRVKIIDDEKKKWEKLVEKIQIDDLTGLYNIQTFKEMVGEALLEMPEEQQGALLLMDIDHFKEINDTYGHSEGDRALKWLAKLLKKFFEEDGIAGRYGGDEFIVYLPDVMDCARVGSICARFCKLVRQRSETTETRLTISMGVAFAHHGDDYDSLFQTADEAMYRVKSDGKDGFWIQDHDDFIQNAQLYDIKNRCTVESAWLDDEQYQTILRDNHMIAFEYDVEKKVQRVSPFVSEYIAGNYDGRMLSQVMVEDGVIHPDDLETSLQFRETVQRGTAGEMTIRLLTPDNVYKWFRMSLTTCKKGDNQNLMIGILADVDVQIRQRDALQSRERYDLVSGIYNRETFFEKTKEILKDNAEKVHYFLRFDIDRFKMVNELFSINEGNKVLRYVGDVLRELSRVGETYARLENDVFCMCIERTEEEAIKLVDGISERIKAYPLAFQFSISVGIVRVEPYCCSPLYALSDRAAIAQRKIKGNYLHHYAFYDVSMGKQLSREHDILMSMEKSLEHEEFQAFLQPKYDVRDNRIVGAEALARWNHPTIGNVSPGEFIPLFEQNSFIVKLDEYIWETVCKTMRGWMDQGIEVVPVSVNVSRIHLYDDEFCDRVSRLCEKYNIPPKLLELEITESAYVERPQSLYVIMEKLQNMGFIFSMDDFGSGYSSLNALKDIPVNIVKIDLRFLEKARRGEEAGRGILKDTIQLMNNLHLSVIAEGVETEEQVEYLQSIGCVYAQGYYYAKPMEMEEFRKLLQKENG